MAGFATSYTGTWSRTVFVDDSIAATTAGDMFWITRSDVACSSQGMCERWRDERTFKQKRLEQRTYLRSFAKGLQPTVKLEYKSVIIENMISFLRPPTHMSIGQKRKEKRRQLLQKLRAH